MNVPPELKYTSHDEWVKYINDDTVIMGITDYAQDALGEIVHVELPEVGDTFEVGEPICEVESVKAVAEVYAPISCEVVEINEDLDGNEETINAAPYDAGWLLKLRVSYGADESQLLNAANYTNKAGKA